MNYFLHCLVVAVLVLWTGPGFSTAQDQIWNANLVAHFSFDVEPDPVNGFVDPVGGWKQGSSPTWNITHSQYKFGGGALRASGSIGGGGSTISSILAAAGRTSFPYIGGSNGPNEFTIAFWISAQGFGSPPNAATIFSGLGGYFKIELFRFNLIRIGISGNSVIEVPHDYTEWTFVTVVRTGNSNSNFYVYLNGVLASDRTVNWPAITGNAAIGANSDGPNYAYALYGNILLDEFWIFDRLLPNEQILALMQTNWFDSAPLMELLLGFSSDTHQVAINGPIYNDRCQIKPNEVRVFFDSWNAPNEVKYHRLGSNFADLQIDVNFWQQIVTGDQQFSLSAIPLCFPYPYMTSTDQVNFLQLIKTSFPNKYWFSPGILELFGPSIAPGENTQARFYYTLLSHRDRMQQVEHFLRVDLVNFFSILMRNRQASLLLISSFFEAAQLEAIEIQIQLLAEAINDITSKSPELIFLDVLTMQLDAVSIAGAFLPVIGAQWTALVTGVFNIATDAYALYNDIENLDSDPIFMKSDSTNVQFTGFGKTTLQQRKDKVGYLFQLPPTSDSSTAEVPYVQITVAQMEAQLISMNEYIITSIDSIMSQVINNYGYMRALSELSFSVEPLSDINSVLGELLQSQDIFWQRTLLIKFFKSQFNFGWEEVDNDGHNFNICTMKLNRGVTVPKYNDAIWDPLRAYVAGLTDDNEHTWFRMFRYKTAGYDDHEWAPNDNGNFAEDDDVPYTSLCNEANHDNWKVGAAINPNAFPSKNVDPQFLSVFGITG